MWTVHVAHVPLHRKRSMSNMCFPLWRITQASDRVCVVAFDPIADMSTKDNACATNADIVMLKLVVEKFTNSTQDEFPQYTQVSAEVL